MFKFKQSLIAFAGLSLLVAAVAFVTPPTGRGQKPSPVPPAQSVTVVNTESQPVPVTGTVNIGNLGGEPLPVRDVDNPARAAFQQTINVGDLQTGTITVPEGKRLVIEFISASFDASPGTCKSTDVQVSTILNGQSAASRHHLIPISAFEAPSVNSFVISQETQIYADSVAPVTFSFFPISGPCSYQGTATVSGHLVDVP